MRGTLPVLAACVAAAFVLASPKPAAALPAAKAITLGESNAGVVEQVGRKYKHKRYSKKRYGGYGYRPYRYRSYGYARPYYRPYYGGGWGRPYYRPYYGGWGSPYYGRRSGVSVWLGF